MKKVITILITAFGLFSCSKYDFQDMDKMNLKEVKTPTENAITIQELEVIQQLLSENGLSSITLDILSRVAPLPNSPDLTTRLQTLEKMGKDRDAPHITKLIRPTSGNPLYSANIIDILMIVALYGQSVQNSPIDYSGNGVIDMVDVNTAIENYGNLAIVNWTNFNPQDIQVVSDLGAGNFACTYSGTVTDGLYDYTGTWDCLVQSTDLSPIPNVIQSGKLTWTNLQVGSLLQIYFSGCNIEY